MKIEDVLTKTEWAKYVTSMLLKKDYVGAAKIIITCKLINEFDCFNIVKELI